MNTGIINQLFNIDIAGFHALDGDVNYSNEKYLLEDDTGKKYILKIFRDPDEWLLAREESLLLADIAPGLSVKVPLNISRPDGGLFFSFEDADAKLLEYVEGEPLASVSHTQELLYLLGQKIGQMNRVLMDIENPVFASRRIFWDLQNTMMSVPKTDLIADPERRKLVRYFLDRYKQYVLPVQHGLRHSLIHGDLNDYNIMVHGGEINGFIDFGDMTCTPLVNEIAIAMAYMMLDKEDPVSEILPLLRGYHETNPLLREEIEILPELITARLCISLCNSAEKKHRGEDNDYVLVSEKPAWDLLERWTAYNPVRVKNAFLSAAGLDNAEPVNEENLLKARMNISGRSLTLSYQEPITMGSARFQYMFDSVGNTYLDAYNNIAHIGHSHPAVSEAISVQVRELNTNTRYLFGQLAAYGERLLGYFPDSLSKVFFANSGSEANDLAIRMARTYNSRNTLAVLEQGYHGITSACIDASSYKFDGRGGKGAASLTLKLPLPNAFRGRYRTGSEYAVDAISRIRKFGEPISAFIAEPLSGCGGQVPLASGYLEELYKFLRSEKIVCISDEVQTGFGRLGDYFWGFEMHGVVPDIVVLGKPMGNGHPVAAVVTTPAIADAFDNGMEFFSSFGGNPVSCMAANAVLDVLEEEKLPENAKTTGDYLLEQLGKLRARHSCIADVRGCGLFLGIEFDERDGNPGTQTAKNVKEELKNKFVLTGTDGPHESVIKIKPPMCFNRDNAGELVRKLDEILTNLE